MSLIKVLNSENLVHYFILPMIGTSPKRLGKFFIGAKLHKEDQVVRLSSHQKLNLKGILYTGVGPDLEVNHYISISSEFHSDADLFRIGLYSVMSKRTKEIIRLNSGLVWHLGDDTKDGEKLSDGRLLALSRDKALKAEIAEEIGVKLSELDGELLAPPKTGWFFLEQPYSAESPT